jgi:hypothetical protein
MALNNSRTGRVENRRKMIRKGFKNTLSLCYYIFVNFELGEKSVFLNLDTYFQKFLRLVFRLSSADFN